MSRDSVAIISEKDIRPFYAALAAGRRWTTEFRDFAEAPEPFRAGPPDLVVIDCGFKAESGLKLLRSVKAACPRTIVVLIAEKSSEETVIEAFRLGVRYYLKKPVRIFNVRNIIREILKVRKQVQERRSPLSPRRVAAGGAAAVAISGKPANLLRAALFMEENLGEPLSLEACARAGSLSKYQFCRAFRRHFGLPPMHFLNSLRLERARELLGRDDLSIVEIAAETGFGSQAGFINAFKKHTGLRPREFRAAARREAGIERSRGD